MARWIGVCVAVSLCGCGDDGAVADGTTDAEASTGPGPSTSTSAPTSTSASTSASTSTGEPTSSSSGESSNSEDDTTSSGSSSGSDSGSGSSSSDGSSSSSGDDESSSSGGESPSSGDVLWYAAFGLPPTEFSTGEQATRVVVDSDGHIDATGIFFDTDHYVAWAGSFELDGTERWGMQYDDEGFDWGMAIAEFDGRLLLASGDQDTSSTYISELDPDDGTPITTAPLDLGLDYFWAQHLVVGTTGVYVAGAGSSGSTGLVLARLEDDLAVGWSTLMAPAWSALTNEMGPLAVDGDEPITSRYASETSLLTRHDAIGVELSSVEIAHWPAYLDLAIAGNGDLVLAGASDYGVGGYMAFARLTPDGTEIWSTVIDTGGDWSHATGIATTPDDAIIGVGYEIDGGFGYAEAIRFDGDGEIVWSHEFRMDDVDTSLLDVAIGPAGEIIVAGSWNPPDPEAVWGSDPQALIARLQP